LTLPKFARQDPLVRNVMMAMEYHKPGTPIRAKEQALNFACSFLRPIEPTLRATLTAAIVSQPIMLNSKRGQEMTNELEMHYIDT